MVIVQRNEIFVFVGTEVNVEVADDGVAIVAVPLTNDQAPVPDVGLFPAKVNVEVLHKDWSAPAADAVANASMVAVTAVLVDTQPVATIESIA